MKSAILLTAMLSGLCAEAMAVPIRPDIRSASIAFDEHALDIPFTIKRDVDFSVAYIAAEFPPEDWELNQPALITTDLNSGESIGETLDANAADGTGASDSLRAPEPPPFGTILIGFACLLGFALSRQRKQRRRVRRHATAAR
jgi:hypothetical protein